MLESGTKVKFGLGRLVGTPAALDALAVHGPQVVVGLLRRHLSGDWGEVPPEDWAANDDALVNGGRVLSAYAVGDEVTVWVITEADGSATTLLLPGDY